LGFKIIALTPLPDAGLRELTIALSGRQRGVTYTSIINLSNIGKFKRDLRWGSHSLPIFIDNGSDIVSFISCVPWCITLSVCKPTLKGLTMEVKIRKRKLFISIELQDPTPKCIGRR